MGRDRLFVVLMGPPGAGKGTQAVRIAPRARDLRDLDRDLLRAAVAAGTEVGRRAEATMRAGELVPDDVILALVDEELDRPGCEAGAVFDGFPRTVEQARGLDGLLERRGETIDGVLVIEVPDEEIVRRLSGRRVCEACGKLYNISFRPSRSEGRCDDCGGALVQRPDDRPETIARRLAVYREETQAVRGTYERRGDVVAIDGARPIDEVAGEMDRRLDAIAR